MNEATKTGIYVVAAIVLLVIAKFVTGSSNVELAQFSDQGEPFYEEFTDPLTARSLEVVQYDEQTGTLHPFKVQVTDGRWSIPSHYDYPADGEDRLATTAASFIDLKKDVVQSDRLQDHETLGVIDPLDDKNPTLTGRGTRVMLRDEARGVLADYIIGRKMDARPGFRYVRLPGKKRTYAVEMDVDLSTTFADWIDTRLLDLQAFNIKSATIRDYRVDEQTGSVDVKGTVNLSKDDSNTWQLQDPPPGRELDPAKVNQMTTALSQLKITGVRPKPAGLTGDLRLGEGLQLDLSDQLSLQSKGFFVSRDGQLLSNEGELLVAMKDGVRYTLRFGEVLVGEGLEVSAGLNDAEPTQENETDPTGQTTGAENRYLFVTAQFDESLLGPVPQPPAKFESPEAEAEGDADGPLAPEDDPAMTDDEFKAAQAEYEQQLEQWQAKAAAGREKVKLANQRFAPWYYVISAGDFAKVRVDMEQLTKPAAPVSG